VGIGVGCEEGCLVGSNDGLFEGKRVGLEVLGFNVGKWEDGAMVGCFDG